MRSIGRFTTKLSVLQHPSEQVMSKPKPTFANLAPEYTSLWNRATINADRLDAVKGLADVLMGNKARYDPVSAQTLVPWFVIGLIHCMEASFSFTTHLHNGNPLGRQTTDVPKGRPLTPPFDDWAHSAVDALEMRGLQNIGANNWTIERIAFELEGYNGWGYRTNNLNVLSPYLWSFTNLYTKGKYVGDHVFDPNFPSKQAGAMAILKRLIAAGVSATAQGPVAPPPPPLPPVPTGKFEADGKPFLLRDSVGAAPTDDSLPVMLDSAVEKIADTSDADWWKISVEFAVGPDAEGFARKEWLRPVLVPQAIQEENFGQACLDVARRYGISAHFLIALAEVESGLTNKVFPGTPFGPFAMTKDDWTANNNKAETGFGDADRFNPYAQPAVAARLVVKLTDDVRTDLPDKRLPTSEELYLGRILTPAGLKLVLAANNADLVHTVLSATMAATDVSAIFALRPTVLTNTIDVGTLRANAVQQLNDAFVKAVALIQKLDPDLVEGPPETIDEQKEVPWVVTAKQQEAIPVEEIPGAASNPEVEKFFTATPLGRQTDDVAWCAAFVSWCIKQSGGSAKHVIFSARAADWLSNGDQLPGPQYGAVAVLKPMAPQSSGHVGFVTAWDGTKVTLLAGNQKGPSGRDAVCEKQFNIQDVRGWRMM
jgi:uncharacterized protein (TIGR02594 family)